MKFILNRVFFLVAAFLCLSFSSMAYAAGGFAGGVAPSRFEVSAGAGDVVRRSISIYNLGDRPNKFGVSTADWTYSEQGSISFSNRLLADSCRPWVKIERPEVTVVASAFKPRNFRFEVHVPEQQPRRECRFAIMLDSKGEPHRASINNGAVAIPVTGRVAVIVYVQVGGAKADLSIEGVKINNREGKPQPVVQIKNSGDAHGRVDADITGITPGGKRLKMSVDTSPILPNQTRDMAIKVVDKTVDDLYPLKLTGKIYTDNSSYNLDATLSP